MKTYHVYMLTNRTYSVLYTGVTSDLESRVWQRGTKAVRGFTSRYDANILVYYEATTDVWAAIAREKEVKLLTRLRRTHSSNR